MVKKQKTDKRDAMHLLMLLLDEDTPTNTAEVP